MPMRPWLIQRGKFKPIPDQEIAGLDSLISYDYMGSSEFEWGALPRSMLSICKNWQSYKIGRMDNIQDLSGNFLYYIYPEVLVRRDAHSDYIVSSENSSVEDLEAIIKKLFSERYALDLKERSECYEHIHGDSFSGRVSEIDFWWDVQYDWMMCFGQDIKRLILAIEKVCVKKELSPAGGPTVKDSIFSTPVFGLDIIKNKMTITDLNGESTVISLGNVKEVTDIAEDPLVVLVKTRAGVDKHLYIKVLPGTKRDYLVKLLREQIELNKRHSTTK